jgi:hypothetical protein
MTPQPQQLPQRFRVRDHLPRELRGLELERAKRVPLDHPGADWRNLPNEGVTTQSGELVAAFEYLGIYGSGRAGGASAGSNGTERAENPVGGAGSPAGTGSTGASRAAEGAGLRASAPPPLQAACACHLPATEAERLRMRARAGVCKAFESRRLLPFVCMHTADTNSGWHGAYGRLWTGACGGALLTTLALPSKGGAYIHPGQDRLYTPREAARLQGFADGFRLGVDEAVAAAGGERPAADKSILEAVAEEVGEDEGDADGEDDSDGGGGSCRGGRGSGGGGEGSAGGGDSSGRGVRGAILTALHAVGNAIPPTFGREIARGLARSAADARWGRQWTRR